MIKGQRRELEWRAFNQEVLPENRIVNASFGGRLRYKRYDDGRKDGGNGLRDPCNRFACVAYLAIVLVLTSNESV